jgi:hypothetical protein
MKRLIENFPSLASFVRPGEMSEPGPGMGGSVDADDVITAPSEAECEELPVQVIDVPDAAETIMQRWYPEDVQLESTAIDGIAANLRDKIARLLKEAGLLVSSVTMERLDEFLDAAVAEHQKSTNDSSPPEELYDAFSNDMKGRG